MLKQINEVMAGKKFRRDCKFTGDDLKENYFNLKNCTVGIRISHGHQLLTVFITDGILGQRKEYERGTPPFTLVTILKDVKDAMKKFQTEVNSEANATLYLYKSGQKQRGKHGRNNSETLTSQGYKFNGINSSE